MPQASVGTTAATLIAADPTHWRHCWIENIGPTNFITIEIGSTATLAGSFQIAAGATSPDFRIPPGSTVSAIASTAACDVRWEVV